MISKCYYCLCPCCNLLHCRFGSLMLRCVWCIDNNSKIPTVDCDCWESKIKRKAYRIKNRNNNRLNKILNGIERIIDKIDN